MFLVGKQTLTVAYATGPGGPVNSLVITNSLYQMLLDVFVDGQAVGKFGIIGFTIGIIGTIICSIGNMVVKKFIKKEVYAQTPCKRIY